MPPRVFGPRGPKNPAGAIMGLRSASSAINYVDLWQLIDNPPPPSANLLTAGYFTLKFCNEVNKG